MEQRLNPDKKVWVWEKDEIAYVADNSALEYSYYIIKVQFTGNRWLSRSGSGDKIYEYNVLDSNSDYHRNKRDKNEVSWDGEEDFYPTLQDALEKIQFWMARKDKSLEEEKMKNCMSLEKILERLS